jgi:hypothetical protein
MTKKYGLLDLFFRILTYLFAIWVFFQLGYKILAEEKIAGSAFLPSSGIVESVSPELISMKSWAKKYRIKNFTVTEELDNVGFYKERIAEFLYPIRAEKNSPWIFASSHFQAPPKCHLKEKESGVALYECKP